MKIYPYRVNGEETTTHAVESNEDFDAFETWLTTIPTKTVLGLDSETTGLQQYSQGFEVRLVQIGTPTEAWVIPAEQFRQRIQETLVRAVDEGRRFVAHNAPYDLLALDAVGIADLDVLGPQVFDTRILAHILDPRSAQEGGTGHGLKALSAIYVDPDAPDTAEGLYTIFRKEYGATKKSGEGWAKIDIDHPTYVLYAGLDVILVTRLLRELSLLVRANSLGDLARFEHRVMLAGCRMQRRGLLLDVPYTEGLVDRLTEEEEHYLRVAQRYGVENVNSTKQVTEGLLGTGEVWGERTASGALAVSKEVLLPMADFDSHWDRLNLRDPNPLAEAVLRSKRASKWRESYALAFLDGRDVNDRVHPSLNVLAARTARMSVSSPPLQQLPASDNTIRNAFIADPGMSLLSCDFSQIEMRLLGAEAGVPGIFEAVAQGKSVHKFTAELLFGPDYPEWRYKIAKNTGFCRVYGGGTGKIAQTSGTDFATAKEVVDAYDAAFPEIQGYGRNLQRLAARSGGVLVSPTGRPLPLDRDRAYAATNYMIQSLARDIFAQGILRLEEAGLGDHLLLPIHDEMLAQAPIAEAEDIAAEISRVLTTSHKGMPIDTDAQVYGERWIAG